MKKGFIFGFVAAIVLVAVVLGAFFLGKSTSTPEAPTSQAVKETVVETTKAETEEATEAPLLTKQLDGIKVTLVEGESWEEGNLKCRKYEVKLQNTSDAKKEGWNVEIDVPDDSVLGDSWNGTVKASGGKLTADNVDYNKDIEPGAEASFGFIIKSANAFALDCNTVSVK